jgi:hypothetical protein
MKLKLVRDSNGKSVVVVAPNSQYQRNPINPKTHGPNCPQSEEMRGIQAATALFETVLKSMLAALIVSFKNKRAIMTMTTILFLFCFSERKNLDISSEEIMEIAREMHTNILKL